MTHYRSARRFLTASLIGLAAATGRPAAAQSGDALHSLLVQSILQSRQASAGSNAAQKTAGAERLIAQSSYALNSGAYFMNDTTQYTYGGGLGSVFNYNTFTWALYGGANAVLLNAPLTGGPGILTQPLVNPYVSCDSSLEQYRTYPASALQKITAIYNTFSPTGALTSQRYFNSNNVKNGTASAYFWSPSGRLDSTYLFSILNGKMPTDTTQKRFFFYNGAGQLVMDSNVYRPQAIAYHPYLKHAYSYGSGGLLNSIITWQQDWNGTVWKLMRRDSMTYNTASQLTLLVSDTGALMMPYKKTQLSWFSPTLPIHQSLLEYTRNNFAPVWDTTTYTVMTLNSANFPGTADRRTYSPNGAGLFYGMKSSIVYDGSNNPLTIRDSTYDKTSGQAAAYITHFYYGLYTPAAVNGASTQSAELSLFPNPASGTLNIRFSAPLSGPYEAGVYTLDGRLALRVHAADYAAGAKASVSCNVAGLPAGTYVLHLSGAGGLRAARMFVRE